ncbi:uncharacterized protein LOC114725356 isoform X2 [Neltuma alba]|uniref:uncharacterized protein LOC114725356 isoform X2 n=2 Tax=Neltuma alba TaxID=207710 RepID=UPI0010A3E100|nr:uncharacterized protein LOC114725356 isoform X2 [Prosopis alba]XP_028767688.1 uncharacterized protein LOC114725356 isoform X2 [Prosopis alba]
MAWRSGSLSRSLMSAARASLRPSPPSPLPRLRPPPLTAPLPWPRRFSSATSRSLGELGCAQSLLPLHNTSTCLTSHFAVSARACCELSHGTFRRSCQDR